MGTISQCPLLGDALLTWAGKVDSQEVSRCLGVTAKILEQGRGLSFFICLFVFILRQDLK